MMKNITIDTVKKYQMGRVTKAILTGCLRRSTAVRTNKNTMNARRAESNGEMNQEQMMPTTPASASKPEPGEIHCTESTPRNAKPTPMSAPTIECVVDTGSSQKVARRSHREAATRAAKLPIMSTSGPLNTPMDRLLGSKYLMLMIPERTVPVTCAPSRTAPENSKIAARIHAPISEMEPAPTDVAKAFATSLAPIPQAMKNAKRPATTTIQRQESVVMTWTPLVTSYAASVRGHGPLPCGIGSERSCLMTAVAASILI
mmetsp:Transcript_3490/g.6199  ORF Transcript_3490/g.6199 Transcript_3490/m.6199 type:complete len:259 (+) Transcript_3490:1757-2533(+)